MKDYLLFFNFQMCPEDRCNKKVVDENNGTYRCEKCNKIYNNFKWSYMISVGIKYFIFFKICIYVYFQAEISDATGSQWINVFRNEGEALLGITADEFGNHKVNVRTSPIFGIFILILFVFVAK